MLTTNPEFSGNAAISIKRQKDDSTKKSNDHSKKTTNSHVEIIRALTPITIALIGGIIGGYALFLEVEETRLTAAMGLAGSAIAGASGLAQQSGKNE
ncbi:hypothetical protein Xen7305DRAFT_00015880 [Xenococcus sp. PCC 7305]|uniref:hypothetical protein n=1 Tax=Xenococcus sp. PCC 7305 TaxID=102125 RepID=UPI0002AC29A0|nr:hypothetical protein [Xenococcus sp. PCC 7305]ELS01881.1 hypothetical protein Xen7305DRAFT_00015880 [Xenococcus sp. PCC 7305]